MPTRPLRVTLVQNNAGGNLAANVDRVDALLKPSPATDLIVLPEVFAFRGSDAEYRHIADPIPGHLTGRLALLAERHQAWLLAGSIIERNLKQVFNTSVLFNPHGHVMAIYRKIHLFEAALEDGRVIRECDIYEHGNTPMTHTIAGWICAFSICYDLRFPELYRHYAAHGAHLMLVPSNFTQRTGKDHWEILIRARAIENQCFVVAPDQCGANPVTGVVSYGHSMAVGPWGEVLAIAGDEETVLHVTLDPASMAATRTRVPALRHRRMWMPDTVRETPPPA